MLRFTAILALFLTLSLPPALAQDRLRIGYFDIPPHVTGVEAGQPRGAAISYFEDHVAPHFGVPFEWDTNVTAPTRLMSQLEKGEIDAMIFLGKTSDREKVFHYPDPYLIIPETVVFMRDHPLERITSAEDLHGLRLGFLVGGRIPEPLQSGRITYDLIAGKRLMERNVEKLLIGRIDGIYAPLSTALRNIVMEKGVGNDVKFVPVEFLPPVEIFTVFSKESVDAETLSRYNNALKKASTEIEYADYLIQYLENNRN